MNLSFANDQIDRLGETIPVLQFLFHLLPAGTRQGIELGFTARIARPPFRPDPPLLFQPVESPKSACPMCREQDRLALAMFDPFAHREILHTLTVYNNASIVDRQGVLSRDAFRFLWSIMSRARRNMFQT